MIVSNWCQSMLNVSFDILEYCYDESNVDLYCRGIVLTPGTSYGGEISNGLDLDWPLQMLKKISDTSYTFP